MVSGLMSGAPLRSVTFDAVAPADAASKAAAWRRLDSLTKPLGALGTLEALAAQVCAVQRTLEPAIRDPVAVVFAADHGVAERGVSAYPRAVTQQMVQNFLQGGAAISVLARAQGMELWIVDAGVDGACGPHPRLIDAKIRPGTRDFVEQPAMTGAECRTALEHGRAIVGRVMPAAGNTLLLGEMGIGNTACAALLMHGLTGVPLHDCVGRGTGLDDEGLERKARDSRGRALARRAAPSDPIELLTEFGGYEIAMLVGAMLAGAHRRSLLIIDGFSGERRGRARGAYRRPCARLLRFRALLRGARTSRPARAPERTAAAGSTACA